MVKQLRLLRQENQFDPLLYLEQTGLRIHGCLVDERTY